MAATKAAAEALPKFQALYDELEKIEDREGSDYFTIISSSHRVVGLGVSFCLFMCHDFLPMPSAAEKTLPLPYLALRASTAL